MRRSPLYYEYLERAKQKKVFVEKSHIENVVNERVKQNPQWGYKSLRELDYALGLPKSAHTPLVRWTDRLPHSRSNSFWCERSMFPTLPTLICEVYSGKQFEFTEWAQRIGLLSEVETRFRKAVYYWSHSDREDDTWVDRAVSREFCTDIWCNVNALKFWAKREEFESCL